ESLALSGGVYVILQHAEFLKNAGHEVCLVLNEIPPALPSWHPALSQLELVTLAEIGERRFDLAVATWWRTAFDLARVSARQYAYLIQDIEYLFYPNAADPARALIEETYRCGLPAIAISPWIGETLAKNFGLQCHIVTNGIDKNLYRDSGTVI